MTLLLATSGTLSIGVVFWILMIIWLIFGGWVYWTPGNYRSIGGHFAVVVLAIPAGLESLWLPDRRVMTTAQLTDIEALKLSAIYRRCLDDLERLGSSRMAFTATTHDQAIELISQAVSEAVAVVSQRCPYCDSSDVTLVCGECGRK